MVLNSYFLQGSPGEQTLMQDLVNEHIKIHGIEVHYLPRKIFKTDDIIKEIDATIKLIISTIILSKHIFGG